MELEINSEQYFLQNTSFYLQCKEQLLIKETRGPTPDLHINYTLLRVKYYEVTIEFLINMFMTNISGFAVAQQQINFFALRV